MSVTSARKLRDIAESSSVDPKGALARAVGDVSGFEPFTGRVLVATYVEPPKIMKGPNGEDITFHKTDRGLAEDRFQGKIGLVLKVGPVAFQDFGTTKFGGMKVEPGDWVMYRASDGFEMFFVDMNGTDGTPCRLLDDVNIMARVSSPKMIY